MGASIISGNVKYVFTQTTAPSGEGEVEGSLWYDTTTNELNTYDGAVWNGIITGSPPIIIEQGQTTGPESSITISSIPTGYKHFRLILTGSNSISGYGYFQLRFNGDSGNNYKTEYMFTDNGTWVSSEKIDTELWTGIQDGSERSICAIDILNIAALTKAINYQAGAYNEDITIGTGIWINTSDEISSITIMTSAATMDTGFTYMLVGFN